MSSLFYFPYPYPRGHCFNPFSEDFSSFPLIMLYISLFLHNLFSCISYMLSPMQVRSWWKFSIQVVYCILHELLINHCRSFFYSVLTLSVFLLAMQLLRYALIPQILNANALTAEGVQCFRSS